AEDGIRDFHVTGVQTCALPIFDESVFPLDDLEGRLPLEGIEDDQSVGVLHRARSDWTVGSPRRRRGFTWSHVHSAGSLSERKRKIGRASCRERVWGTAVRGTVT